MEPYFFLWYLTVLCRAGITGRDEYEKVSRDIRYGFYNQVLGASGCSGVIFGHHLGDVQENVISNVMRLGKFQSRCAWLWLPSTHAVSCHSSFYFMLFSTLPTTSFLFFILRLTFSSFSHLSTSLTISFPLLFLCVRSQGILPIIPLWYDRCWDYKRGKLAHVRYHKLFHCNSSTRHVTCSYSTIYYWRATALHRIIF